MDEGNSAWLPDNESYLKNRKRRRITAAALVLTAVLVAVFAVIYTKDSDRREYSPGIDKYYADLNEGSGHTAEYIEQEIKDTTEKYLDQNGFADTNEWYAALQQLDCRKLEEKYGKGFTVVYRIEKTEKLTSEELTEISANSANAGTFDKGYRLHIREHFKGSKADGFEEQDIVVTHLKDRIWQFTIDRWLELQNEL